MSVLNLSKLETIKEFRAEELYFIRMANAYIAAIFWEGVKVNNPKRKREFYAFVDEKLNRPTHRFLRDAIIPDPQNNGKRNGHLDCISGVFTTQIIKQMPQYFVEQFDGKRTPPDTTPGILRLNHGLFINLNDDLGRNENQTFFKLVETLKNRRHFLEHYREKEPIEILGNFKSNKEYKKSKEFEDYKGTINKIEKIKNSEILWSDESLIRSMSKFLLPEILHYFASRVAHYENKYFKNLKLSNAKSIREIIIEEIKERRENTKNLFEGIRNKKSNKDKAKRKSLLSDDIPWRREFLNHRLHRGRGTDYRENEFKIRYYFIGAKNINAIKNKLGIDEIFHFKREIEAFYLLSARIGFLIVSAIGKISAPCEELSKIRDIIAHNGLFWNSEFETEEIFKLIFQGLNQSVSKSDANNFYDLVKARLKSEQYHIVDIAADKVKNIKAQYFVIRKWDNKKREKYLNKSKPNISLDKRKTLRRICWVWEKYLDDARESSR